MECTTNWAELSKFLSDVFFFIICLIAIHFIFYKKD